MVKATQEAKKVDPRVLNEDLENYFANTIIPQLFVDADMILRKFTPPAMKQFSLKADDVGRHIEDVQDNIRYPTLIDNITEVIETGSILEKEVQTTDKRWFQMNILPYVERKSNRPNGVIITFVDITTRLNTLKELEKLNSDHHTLMFALSHDIRQPLSTMLMVSDELAQGVDEHDVEQFQKWVGVLKRASSSMKELVDDFTEHIRMRDAGPSRDERINIGNIFDDTIMALYEEIHENKVEISSNFAPVEILFPRKDIRSILYNLVNNAIKYRKPDAPLHIHVSSVKEEDHVLLTVTDDGLGIALEHHASVFLKYTRINRAIEGTGMGLYIISRMLEARGDRVELQSEIGKGSSFRVYIQDREAAPVGQEA